jgi:hypothetical protein
MPLTSADDKDALIWAYDSTQVKRDAIYVNELAGYCHRAALGLGVPNARAKMIPAYRPGDSAGRKQPDGFHILVLLPQPVRAICLINGSSVLFSAAIMREYGNGQVESWLISCHRSALATWAENYPEASAP